MMKVFYLWEPASHFSEALLGPLGPFLSKPHLGMIPFRQGWFLLRADFVGGWKSCLNRNGGEHPQRHVVLVSADLPHILAQHLGLVKWVGAGVRLALGWLKLNFGWVLF